MSTTLPKFIIQYMESAIRIYIDFHCYIFALLLVHDFDMISLGSCYYEKMSVSAQAQGQDHMLSAITPIHVQAFD